MMEEFILGFFIASLLGFIVLYRLLGKRPQRAEIKAQTGPSGNKSSEHSVSQKDGGTDVVVVGAGVAGSTLAYSLAKVSLRLYFM